MSPSSPFEKMKNLFKAYQTHTANRFLSPVRRIERIAPPADRRVVAFVFDNGPTAGATGSAAAGRTAAATAGAGTAAATTAATSARGTTEAILAALEAHGARATFNIIGTTAENYPDTQGEPGTPLWNGVKFDHYPAFERDAEGGAVNQPDLVRRLVAGGHELANHSYSHVPFGRPAESDLASRVCLTNSTRALDDLRLLHNFIRDNFSASGAVDGANSTDDDGYEMRLARPPRGIDRTLDGKDAYYIFAEMGYNYLAASFDGGGWWPSTGSHAGDVAAMATPVEEALRADEGALNGQIIHLNDGYDPSGKTPVVDALPLQLEALRRAGYEIVTVSELLEITPFADLAPDDEGQEAVRGLLAAGHVVAYKNNTFLPDRDLSLGELAAMMLPRQVWRESAETRTASAVAAARARATQRGGRGGLGPRGGAGGVPGAASGTVDGHLDDAWEAATGRGGMFGLGGGFGGGAGAGGGAAGGRPGDMRLRDVRPSHPYYEAIQAVITAGLRVPAGLYKPDMFASRQYALEALAVVTGHEPPRLRDRHGISRREFAIQLWQAIGRK